MTRTINSDNGTRLVYTCKLSSKSLYASIMRFSMTFSAKMPVRTAKRSFSSLPTGSNIIKRQINVVSVEILSLMSACALCLSLRRLLRSMSLSLGVANILFWSSIAVSRRLADNSSVSDIAISHNWCHWISQSTWSCSSSMSLFISSSARLSMEVFARSSCLYSTKCER